MTDVAAAPGSDLIPSSHYRVCLRRVVRAPGPAAPPRVCPPEIVYQPLPLTHAAATVLSAGNASSHMLYRLSSRPGCIESLCTPMSVSSSQLWKHSRLNATSRRYPPTVD